MNKNILVFIDHFKGEAQAASWEAIAVGKTLVEGEGKVSALVLGHGVASLANTAFQYGADEVLLAESPTLEDYRPEPWADVIAQVAREHAPDVMIFPTTTRAKELAGMAAVDLETGVLVDVVNLIVENGTLIATRPIYAGKLLSTVKCEATPQIVTLRGRAFASPEPDAALSGTPTPVGVELAPDGIATSVVDYAKAESGISLKDANVIVSGGRGVSNNASLSPPADISEDEQEIWKAEQGFKLINELAAVLGAAVGASRAAVDANYIPYEHQVGQTGKVVSPNVYIACGISGAIQHLAGMRTSKVIVAINKDADAPIFKLARFGVVGDLFDILPPLIESFKESLG
ncbi:MAG: electron transfer flavoprotein subunit alpha/FixB family protein [Chloroflexota bacterium]|nr:MAG: electron transfer flavoprotein subunit alpha/FixB family protein [Chloroflexota bacterium]